MTDSLRYRLQFSDGREEVFEVDAPAGPPSGALPEWTKLEFHQCANCPLSPAQVTHCPLAVRLQRLVEVSGKHLSHGAVTAIVESPGRTVEKRTTLQDAAGSLMGLLSATSGCPRFSFLEPMARFHLPFANVSETVYRAVSTYLLAQYLVAQHGGTPDWSLGGLRDAYRELAEVNQAVFQRIVAGSENDGARNALVILDSLGRLLQLSLDDALSGLWPVFEAVVPPAP